MGSTEAWRYVTDGGLETDLIFHHGVDLPEFAAYPLVWTDEGRALLRGYYDGYADVAAAVGAGLRLEAPTWRANTDWGAALGHDVRALADANREAVALLQGLAHDWRSRLPDIVVTGMVGPRGDGYAPGAGVDPDEAADYVLPQVRAFAQVGAHEVCALTLTDPGEAIGVVRAADACGLPVAIGFTVETDGRLPDGTTLSAAVERVDAAAPPAYFLVNCAHPQHLLPAFEDDGPWVERVRGVRSNASTASHAELDEAETLDEGDLDVFVSSHRRLEERLPALEIVSPRCGASADRSRWSAQGDEAVAAVAGHLHPAHRRGHAEHGAGDGDDHHATGVELVDELVGQGARHRRDEDPVVRRGSRQAEDAWPRLVDARPRQVVLVEVAGAELHEVGLELDAEHPAGRTGEVGEQGGGPPRPGTDVEHLVPGLHVQQPQHRPDRPRLAVGLSVTDRQRPVVPRTPPLAAGQEPLPWTGQERLRHAVHLPTLTLWMRKAPAG
jgi:homocysteine S-methyltransferase